MVETFSIQEEKFVNQEYFLKLGVSFNKKIFSYLEKRNIYPHKLKRKNSYLFLSSSMKI